MKIEFHCGHAVALAAMKAGEVTPIWIMGQTQERCAQLGMEVVQQARGNAEAIKVFCNNESVLLGLRVAIKRLQLEEDPDVTVHEHYRDKESVVRKVNRNGRIQGGYPDVFESDTKLLCELIRNKP